MPHPGVWTAQPRGSGATAPPATAGGSADVIAGPVVIAAQAKPAGTSNSDEVKADLEQLFAVRDADFKRHSDGPEPHNPARGDAADVP